MSFFQRIRSLSLRQRTLWYTAMVLGGLIFISVVTWPFLLMNSNAASQQAPTVLGSLNSASPTQLVTVPVTKTPTATPLSLVEDPRQLYDFVTARPSTSMSKMGQGEGDWSWEMTAFDGRHNACTSSLGIFVAEAIEDSSYQYCMAKKSLASGNFAYQAPTMLGNGSGTDGGGLYLMCQDDIHAYRIHIDWRGSYDIFDKQYQNMMTGTSADIQRVIGLETKITIIVRNQELYLYFNQTFVGKVAIAAGSYQIGVYAQHKTTSTLASMMFREMTFWAL